RPQIERFALQHRLKIGTIADLIRHRLRNERSIERIADQIVQTSLGEFRLYAYRDRVEGFVHLALARGRLDGPEVPLVRVHVADTLRDVLGVRGESRAWTLRAALERIAQARNGVVVLLREQESTADLIEALRGLVVPSGAAHHGAADAGRAAAALSAAALTAAQGPAAAGRPVLRTYGIGAQILKDLGVRRMRVLSAPKQMHGLSAFDLEVESYADEA
ncbi:MAG TPA: hypothetical protein VEV18_01250, partial [Steroidobacteraceae bacterium]|nr:hypothetical protein [Steroidobacteraceae bacterium]